MQRTAMQMVQPMKIKIQIKSEIILLIYPHNVYTENSIHRLNLFIDIKKRPREIKFHTNLLREIRFLFIRTRI